MNTESNVNTYRQPQYVSVYPDSVFPSLTFKLLFIYILANLHTDLL